MSVLAGSFTVSGVHGFLVLIAFLLFTVAAILAWVMGKQLWGTFVAAGLALLALSQLWY